MEQMSDRDYYTYNGMVYLKKLPMSIWQIRRLLGSM